jgi:transposase
VQRRVGDELDGGDRGRHAQALAHRLRARRARTAAGRADDRDGRARLPRAAGLGERLGRARVRVEGTGCYGAGLARLLAAAGWPVFEVERPERQQRRRGKSDALDAERAARRLLAGERLALLRGQGPRETLRLLLLERRSAASARTSAINQLHGLLVTAPEPLRERLADLHADSLVGACLRLRPRQQHAHATIARRLAGRAQQLADELALIDQQLTTIINQLAPELLAQYGVGPFCAAQLLVSAGDPRRLKNEAAFARLAGTSPLPASSGQTQRHRLNRGGDRQLNYALHLIALQRVRFHDETRAYYQRLQNDGKSKREALRCIKRALSRRLYRLLAANPNLQHATT